MLNNECVYVCRHRHLWSHHASPASSSHSYVWGREGGREGWIALSLSLSINIYIYIYTYAYIPTYIHSLIHLLIHTYAIYTYTTPITPVFAGSRLTSPVAPPPPPAAGRGALRDRDLIVLTCLPCVLFCPVILFDVCPWFSLAVGVGVERLALIWLSSKMKSIIYSYHDLHLCPIRYDVFAVSNDMGVRQCSHYVNAITASGYASCTRRVRGGYALGYASGYASGDHPFDQTRWGGFWRTPIHPISVSGDSPLHRLLFAWLPVACESGTHQVITLSVKRNMGIWL